MSDVFPTVFHLLGKKVPVGVLGRHLFVARNQTIPGGTIFDNEGKDFYETIVGNLGIFNFSVISDNRVAYPFDQGAVIDESDYERIKLEGKMLRTVNKILLTGDTQSELMAKDVEKIQD